MRVQEAARDLVVPEGAVDRVGGQHGRQRQHAAGQALGQAQEVRPDAGLLVREQRAGAAEADRDLVEHQMHPPAVAQLAHPAQVDRIVHRHAGGALHQRLQDDRGRLRVVRLQPDGQCGGGPLGHVGGAFARAGTAGVGAVDGGGQAHQRRIGVAEDAQIGDRQRPDRLAVVAAGQADEAGLVRLALVAPGMRAHLQRDLGGRGAVAAVEGMAQAGERTQPLGQLHHRRMGEAGQHDVIEPAELVDQRLAQRRVVVAEQVDPPGADAVEDAPPLGVMQPDALGAHHRHQRQAGPAAGLALVQLHLGAGMPHRAQAASAPVVVQAHVGRSFFSAAARSAPGSPDASAVPSPGSSRP